MNRNSPMTRPHLEGMTLVGRPFRLSTWVAIVGWVNVFVLAWLMIGRVVSPEGMNRDIFWVFLFVSLGSSIVRGLLPSPAHLPETRTTIVPAKIEVEA